MHRVYMRLNSKHIVLQAGFYWCLIFAAHSPSVLPHIVSFFDAWRWNNIHYSLWSCWSVLLCYWIVILILVRYLIVYKAEMASKNNSFITETADADVVLSVETEDLVTCSVCLYEYDQNIRQPKCIPCSHTFCSLCLEVIQLMRSQLFYAPKKR